MGLESTTRKDLLEVQSQQFAQWEILLKKEVFEELKKIVLSSNNDDDVKENFWKIKRGVNIDNILHNQVRNLFNK